MIGGAMRSTRDDQWNHLIAWEFTVHGDNRAQFEHVYGPCGRWAQFFEQGDGYAGTELHRDLNDATRYVTLDKWISREAYERFCQEHRVEYALIDAECESLTLSEKEIGRFERLG
jgi:quinol monooxygenase YgiN